MRTRAPWIVLLLLLGIIAGCAQQQPSEPAAAQGGEQKQQAEQESAAEPEAQEAELPQEATAVIRTTAGELRCELFPQKTPKTVANFIGLAEGTKTWKHPASNRTKRGEPLYHGTIFHRVIPNFMIQGGDPLGTGTGDPGYEFEDEIVSDLKFDRPGRLAMANSGPDTNGSQFFITEVPTPHLNGKHTIFGQCDRAAVQLVKRIARRPADPRNDRPYDPVKIEKVEIIRAGGEAESKTEAGG